MVKDEKLQKLRQRITESLRIQKDSGKDVKYIDAGNIHEMGDGINLAT